MRLEIAACYNLIKSELKEKESADKIVRRKDNCFIIDFLDCYDEEFEFFWMYK